jgi:general secretion pathway protein J
MKRSRRFGFTLIEVLVAISIFGILATFAYATLTQTLLSAQMLGERMDRLQAVQKAVRAISTDFQQLSPRPVRNDFGDTVSPALISDARSGNLLELTHGGWSNPARLPRGTQQRSAYRLENGELFRYHWPVLDRTMSAEFFETKLLDGVNEMIIRYLQPDGEWIDHWPPRNLNSAEAIDNQLTLRPRAVEFVLDIEGIGEIRRIVEVSP